MKKCTGWCELNLLIRVHKFKTTMFRKAMFSFYGFVCYISGISVVRQMILHLKRKNLHFIFAEKSDRAIVHSELEPHKR